MRHSPPLGYGRPMPDSGVRLTELLVALSLATDLGLGQPAEHMLRAARIGMRLGERLGLDPDELATLYDVSILTYVGCPVYGNEAATLFGDDIGFRQGAVEIDLTGFPAMLFMLRRAGYGTSGFNRVRQAAGIMATGGKGVVEQMANHCSAAGELADRLGLGDGVRAGVEQSYARWDGKGVPGDVAGDALALSARISHIAEACEVFQRTAGVDQAVEMVRSRSGTHFDPAIAAAVESDPEGLFEGLADDTVDRLLDAEPVERPPLTDDELDAVLEAIADFCDLRCPYFAGHGRGTAELVAAAAGLLQLPPTQVDAGPAGGARPRRRPLRCAGVGVGQGGRPHQQRPRAHADARLLRGTDLQPARTAAADRPAGRDPPRAHGRLRLPPGRRRDDAVHPRPGAGRGRRLPRHDPTPSAPGPDDRGRRRPPAAAGRRRGTAGPSRHRRGAGRGRTDGEPFPERRARRSHRPGGRRARAAGPGPAQQGDRPPAGDQPQDGGQPRRAHLHQARRLQPGRRRHAGHATRPRRA